MLPKRLAVLVLCAAIGLPSALAIANGGPRHPSGAEREHRSPELRIAYQLERLQYHVDLSDEQRRDVEALLATQHETLQAMRPQREDHRTRLTGILTAPTIDRQAFRSFHRERQQEATEQHQVLFESMLDIADILTVEQRQQAADWLLRLGRPHRPDADARGPRHRPEDAVRGLRQRPSTR